MLETLVDNYPKTPLYKRFLAAALNTRGEMLLTQQDIATATAEFDRARQVLAGVADRPEADIADLQVLAETLTCLGTAARADRQSDVAVAKFEEAVDVLTDLTTRAPEHQIASRELRKLQELIASVTDEVPER